MKRIVDGLIRDHEGRKVPVILFTKNGGLWLETMADSGCDALGLDWTINIGEARRRVGERVALQGNLDPAVLYAPPAVIRAEVKRILDDFGDHPGHIFNLGHGITPGGPGTRPGLHRGGGGTRVAAAQAAGQPCSRATARRRCRAATRLRSHSAPCTSSRAAASRIQIERSRACQGCSPRRGSTIKPGVPCSSAP